MPRRSAPTWSQRPTWMPNTITIPLNPYDVQILSPVPSVNNLVGNDQIVTLQPDKPVSDSTLLSKDISFRKSVKDCIDELQHAVPTYDADAHEHLLDKTRTFAEGQGLANLHGKTGFSNPA